MTQAEYALHRGVSAVAVHKAVKAQRISLINGKIDPAVADIQWAANTRPRADQRPAASLAAAQAQASTHAAGAQASAQLNAQPVPQALAPADDDGDDYWAARSKRERAEAAIAEMRLAELEGKLIRSDAIRSAWSRKIATTRDALLQIPHRLAPILAAEADMERVGQLLEDELRQALAELSRTDATETA
jgi:hypothetical protein